MVWLRRRRERERRKRRRGRESESGGDDGDGAFLPFHPPRSPSKPTKRQQATACTAALAARDALSRDLHLEQHARARAEAALRSSRSHLTALERGLQDAKIDQVTILRAYQSYEENIKKGEIFGGRGNTKKKRRRAEKE